MKPGHRSRILSKLKEESEALNREVCRLEEASASPVCTTCIVI